MAPLTRSARKSAPALRSMSPSNRLQPSSSPPSSSSKPATEAAAAAAAVPEKKRTTSKPPAFQMKFEQFPLHLRKGPWSPVAYIYLLVMFSGLAFVFTHTDLLVAFPQQEAPSSSIALLTNHVPPRLINSACGIYMLCVLGYMFSTVGPWPLASYTMVSWCFLTARHLLQALDAPIFVREVLRFPALVGAFTTTLVWWLILVPVIYYVIPTATEKAGFVKFNFSPFLINVHLLNFPLCLIDNALSPRQLVATDLWVGILVALSYIMFYLLVLDANGVHFYIIFSPRTSLFAVSASMVLCLYWGIWTLFI